PHGNRAGERPGAVLPIGNPLSVPRSVPMKRWTSAWQVPERAPAAMLLIWLASCALSTRATAATNLPSYYAHSAAQDSNGVIAPWYQGLNGQLDERLNIAVNVYKRYPWVDKPKAVMAAPDFVYNSHWSINADGTILIPPTTDWMCGDLCA